MLLCQADLSQISLGEFRASIAEHNAVLEERKDEVNAWVQAEVQKPAATPQHALWRSLVLKSRISSTKSICHNPKPRNHVTLPFGNGATRFQAEEAAFQQAGFDSSHHLPRFDRAGAVIEYAPDHSTEQMQLFVHQRQLHLKG